MRVRRVVAGNDARGKSVLLSDGAVPNSHDFESMPGQAQARVWFTAGPPVTTPPGSEPTSNTGPVVPGFGGASFVIVQYAPDSVVTDPRFDAERAGEVATYAPDIAEASDPAEPGMHRTPSVDYGVVLDGEIWLELDDGTQTRLTRGDTIVQIGGRHAWRNKTDRPAAVAFVITGTGG
ncbi:cupin domain-containing protein [Nocardia sp. NBC_01730]|uniref:cupin domain-containing protein n=1 Tax=Nocardia sp. NBC_01730 TaxID=2975998 RepID=UPI002E1622A8|nr:cupin domain-containing protein [Nocardia sp. NBC_01730]